MRTTELIRKRHDIDRIVAASEKCGKIIDSCVTADQAVNAKKLIWDCYVNLYIGERFHEYTRLRLAAARFFDREMYEYHKKVINKTMGLFAMHIILAERKIQELTVYGQD